MAGLVRQQDRSLERERALSGAGAELVAATDREEIDRVAVARPPRSPRPGASVALCRPRRRRSAARRRRRRRTGSRRRAQSLDAGRLDARRGDAASRRTPGAGRGARRRAAADAHPRAARPARAAPRRAPRCCWSRREAQRLQGRARRAARARHPGRARARQRGAQRGGAPAPRRGTLRVARAPRERPHHGARARHDGQLPEPVDRARPRLRAGRSRSGTRFDRLASPATASGLRACVAAAAAGDRVQSLECALVAPRRRDAAQFEILFTEPHRRRARRRHPAQRPRRQRAQGVRGRARAPGVPRPRDRPRQPRDVRRAGPPRDRARPPRDSAHRR